MIAGVLAFLYGAFWLFILLALVYFIHKRIRSKKVEDFEKRDN